MYRKNCLLGIIAHYGYLSAYMLVHFCPTDLFAGLSYDSKLRKIRYLLLKCYEEKHVKRFRIGSGEYVYYVEDRRSKQWKHIFMRNKYITENKIKDFEYEYNFMFGRADAFYKHKGFSYFLEVDTGAHDFKQNITKYESYYKSQRWKTQFQLFPTIVVYTTRPETIKKLVHIASCELEFNIVSCYL